MRIISVAVCEEDFQLLLFFKMCFFQLFIVNVYTDFLIFFCSLYFCVSFFYAYSVLYKQHLLISVTEHFNDPSREKRLAEVRNSHFL